MRIPATAIIAPGQLTEYLLRYREHDDKSNFLALSGFTDDNPQDLEPALRALAKRAVAREFATDPYGTFLRADGTLRGAVTPLRVTTIWQLRHADSSIHFVTLFPRETAR